MSIIFFMICLLSLVIFVEPVMVPAPDGGVLGALESADCFDDLLRKAGLGEQGKGRISEGLLHEVAIGESSMNNDRQGAPIFANFPEHRRTAEVRHRQVEHDD